MGHDHMVVTANIPGTWYATRARPPLDPTQDRAYFDRRRIRNRAVARW
jgi:hypothetical protein